jgi:hypothetical protein
MVTSRRSERRKAVAHAVAASWAHAVSSARAFAPLLVLVVASAASCRGGCASRGGEAALPVELLRRVQSPADATPVAVDIGDERDVFLVAGARGPVQLWSEVGAGAAEATLPAGGLLLAARFAAGGSVFLAQQEGEVRLLRPSDGSAELSHAFGTIGRRAAISADAAYIAFGGAVLDRGTGAEVGERKPLATQSALSFASHAPRVVSAGFQEPWVNVRDLPGGATREWLAPGKVTAAALSSDGALVAAALQDGTLCLWRQPGGEPVGSWQGHEELRALSFGERDESLIAADPEGVFVSDVAARRERWRDDIDGTLWVFAVDGNLAAAGTTDGSVWLWDLSQQKRLAQLRLSSSAIVAVDISARRQRVLAADETGAAAIWGWH